MNTQLSLILARCQLAYIADGNMVFTCKPSRMFANAPRYAAGIERGKDSELRLHIVFCANDDVFLELNIEGVDFQLDQSDRRSSATVTALKIENWLLKANIDINSSRFNPTKQNVA